MAAASGAASLPVGMQLVSALDETDAQRPLSPVAGTASAAEQIRRALRLPLDSEEAVGDVDMDMEIDVDVFRPSAMLDSHLADAFGGADVLNGSGRGYYYGSCFQPDLGEAEVDIEQMLLSEAELGLTGSTLHHQHETAPGQGCHCRTFAIHANRVQAQQERTVAAAAKGKRRVLRHTFGSGTRLQGFAFGDGSQQPLQNGDVEMADDGCPASSAPLAAASNVAMETNREFVNTGIIEQTTPVVVVKQETIESSVSIKQEVLSTPKYVPQQPSWGPKSPEAGSEPFHTPLRRSSSMPAGSSPLSTSSFVSLESVMATPLSTISRSTAHPATPVMMRSLSPADELEKVAMGGAKSSLAKMNVVRGNFQVSPGQDSAPLVKPTPTLPPPYFRGALDSPEKRRAHSKTFNAFAQSLSFSFSNETSTDT
ncbi:hypothetical protein BBJ28_00010289 [Nothophytophthora sp. Chile5]|nr:hypothetical protein BBJ28_00010289 [Nothophytophthora sp. Chile5]